MLVLPPRRTTGEARHALGVKPPVQKDSLYKPVERLPVRFSTLKVPKELQAALPFKSKPKDDVSVRPKKGQKGPTVKQGGGGGGPRAAPARVPVVREPAERKQAEMMHRLHAMYNAKEKKRKAKVSEQRSKEHAKRQKEEAATAAASAQVRKKRYVRMGMEEKRNAKRAKTAGAGDD